MSMHYALCRDMEKARTLREAGKKLPANLWAALVAEETGLPTYLHCQGRPVLNIVWEQKAETDATGRTFCTLRDTGVRELDYLPPSHLANRGYPWQRAIGEAAMLRLVALLADPVQHGAAHNAALGVEEEDDPYGETPPQRLRRMMAKLRGGEAV